MRCNFMEITKNVCFYKPDGLKFDPQKLHSLTGRRQDGEHQTANRRLAGEERRPFWKLFFSVVDHKTAEK